MNTAQSRPVGYSAKYLDAISTAIAVVVFDVVTEGIFAAYFGSLIASTVAL
jgi:hypothetical protein